MQLNFLDKVAMQVAPRWATNRIRARLLVDTLSRHYEAAQPGFRTAGWRRSAADPNAAIGPALHSLRNHARDLVRNNGWARRGKQVIANNTVGWGIAANPVDSGTRAQNKARQLWKSRAGTTECHVAGDMTFAGIQRMVIDTVVQSGEVLIRRYRRASSAGLSIPMQLQVLEADYIDSYKDGQRTPEGNRIIQGIEFDDVG